MSELKKKQYKGFEIHIVNGLYKYDLYEAGNRWITSVNSLKQAREYITNLIWARENVPF